MRILEVAGTGGVGVGHMGPVTTVITYLANSLANLDCDVTVVDARTDKNRTTLNLDKIRLIEIDSPKWPKDKEISSIKKFVNGLSKEAIEKYDIVHVHEFIMAKEIKESLSIDCVYTAHTPQMWADANLPFKRKLQNFISRALGNHEYNFIQSCKLTIALGSYLQRCVNGGNIRVIQNGTDLSRWERVNNARAKLGIGNDEFVLLFVGRLDRSKGCHLLIEAVRRLDIKNLRVIIVGKLGDDEYSKKISLLAKGLPVTFSGFVSNRTKEFLKYLSAADVLVVPSLFDNQPTTVIEGLSMSLPVIGSNSGGIPDMLNPNVGLLFEPGNVGELAQCIRKLYEDPALCKKMSAYSRRYALENYTWDICAKRHLKEFEKLLK